MQWLDSALNILAPGWVGSVIGLASLIAALATYALTRQRTSVAYAYCGDRLLGSSTADLPSEISVQYKGVSIPRLTRSVLVIWNNGEKTIVKEDIAGRDPLRVSIGSDGKILAVSILKLSRAVNEVALSYLGSHEQDIGISFNFFDASDGLVLEILHTSEVIRPVFNGTLRGIPKGMKDFGRVARPSLRGKGPFSISAKILAWASTLVGLAVMLTGVFASAEGIEKFMTTTPAPGWIILVIFGSTYFFGGICMMYLLRRKHPRALHIEDLE